MGLPIYTIRSIKKNFLSDRLNFYESIENRAIPKIEEDIEFILAKGWADAVSPEDLFHCHVLIPNFYQDTKVDERMISTGDIRLLYHSREFQTHIIKNRNILSSLTFEPRTINGKRSFKSDDLKCWDLCQINFGLTEDDFNATTFDLHSFEKIIHSGRHYFGIYYFGPKHQDTNNMRQAFHYTPTERYEQIKRQGFLAAKSHLITPEWKRKSGVEIPSEKYIFAFLDTPEPEGWKQSGYLDSLLNKNCFRGKKTSLLSFPLNGEQAFVLEARPIFDLSKGEMKAPEAFRRYAESMINVREYSDEYEMPELVIAGDIPIERIRLEGRL